MSTKTRMIRVTNRNAPITIKLITRGLKSPASDGSSVFEASCPPFEPAASVICEGGSLSLPLVVSAHGKGVGLTIVEVVGCIMDTVLVAVLGVITVFPTCGLSCMEPSMSLH